MATANRNFISLYYVVWHFVLYMHRYYIAQIESNLRNHSIANNLVSVELFAFNGNNIELIKTDSGP